jgi:hypothetical protein
LAKHNICNVIDFGKLSFPEILDFEAYIKQTDPSMAKQNQEEAEINKMIEVFKNVK